MTNYIGRPLTFPTFEDVEQNTDFSHCTLTDYFPEGIPEEDIIDPTWVPSVQPPEPYCPGSCPLDPNFPHLVARYTQLTGRDKQVAIVPSDPAYPDLVSAQAHMNILSIDAPDASGSADGRYVGPGTVAYIGTDRIARRYAEYTYQSYADVIYEFEGIGYPQLGEYPPLNVMYLRVYVMVGGRPSTFAFSEATLVGSVNCSVPSGLNGNPVPNKLQILLPNTNGAEGSFFIGIKSFNEPNAALIDAAALDDDDDTSYPTHDVIVGTAPGNVEIIY